MEYKKLLILGASGKIGQSVVKIATELGYDVSVVVRSKTSVENIKNITIIEGSVLDTDILEKAIQGQDAVLSCLGIKRTSQSNPWSPLASPSNFTESVIKNALPIMTKHGIKRFVGISAAGVGDSWDTVSPLMKFIIRSSNIKLAFADFDKMEKALLTSNIDSLTVRPVGLVDGNKNTDAKIVSNFKMSSQISRKDVAEWMMDALERKGTFNKSSEMIGW